MTFSDLSDLSKYSMTWSIMRSLSNNWTSWHCILSSMYQCVQMTCVLFSSMSPSTDINEVDACCYQHTLTILVCWQHYTSHVKIHRYVAFRLTVRRYKRSPTLGVINRLHGRNLLTTVDTPLVIPKRDIGIGNRYFSLLWVLVVILSWGSVWKK